MLLSQRQLVAWPDLPGGAHLWGDHASAADRDPHLQHQHHRGADQAPHGHRHQHRPPGDGGV